MGSTFSMRGNSGLSILPEDTSALGQRTTALPPQPPPPPPLWEQRSGRPLATLHLLSGTMPPNRAAFSAVFIRSNSHFTLMCKCDAWNPMMCWICMNTQLYIASPLWNAMTINSPAIFKVNGDTWLQTVETSSSLGISFIFILPASLHLVNMQDSLLHVAFKWPMWMNIDAVKSSQVLSLW